ncbi:MAG: hypothetical protein AAB280_07300 [Pseudomonadota bacterium]
MLIDEADAEQVERVWRRLMPFDRGVLRMHYIWQAPASAMCRRLRIRHNPPSVLDLAIAHARREIGKVLNSMAKMQAEVSERLRANIRHVDYCAL